MHPRDLRPGQSLIPQDMSSALEEISQGRLRSLSGVLKPGQSQVPRAKAVVQLKRKLH